MEGQVHEEGEEQGTKTEPVEQRAKAELAEQEARAELEAGAESA